MSFQMKETNMQKRAGVLFQTLALFVEYLMGKKVSLYKYFASFNKLHQYKPK